MPITYNEKTQHYEFRNKDLQSDFKAALKLAKRSLHVKETNNTTDGWKLTFEVPFQHAKQDIQTTRSNDMAGLLLDYFSRLTKRFHFVKGVLETDNEIQIRYGLKYWIASKEEKPATEYILALKAGFGSFYELNLLPSQRDVEELIHCTPAAHTYL
jgi:hypothetical protein